MVYTLVRGRTIILVTHHVGLCLKGASYIVALKEGKVAGAGDPQTMVKSGVLGEELSRTHGENSDAEEEAAVEGPIPTVPQKQQSKNSAQAEGAGKLVQEEVRAEGGVKWSVYDTYISASGGYRYWAILLILFAAAQAGVLIQDYWIKVWASAYPADDAYNDVNGTMTTAETTSTASSTGIFSINGGGFGSSSSEPGTFGIHYVNPYLSKETSVDVKYYLGVYFLLGIVALVAQSLRSLIMFIGSIRASRRLHQKLLDRILHAKVRFFDTTPLGKFKREKKITFGLVGPLWLCGMYVI